jgi:hypothetical protein
MPEIPATEECSSSRSRLEAAGGVVSEVEGVKTLLIGLAWWCRPVLLGMQKAEIRGSSSKKTTKAKTGGSVAQVVEQLSSKYKALNSNPSITKQTNKITM